MADPSLDELIGRGEFVARHLGPSAADERTMLQALGIGSRAERFTNRKPAYVSRWIECSG